MYKPRKFTYTSARWYLVRGTGTYSCTTVHTPSNIRTQKCIILVHMCVCVCMLYVCKVYSGTHRYVVKSSSSCCTL